MHSHDWNCDNTHNQFDCPRNYPTSNVRVFNDFDMHAQQALDLANQPGIAAAIRKHPTGKGI